ncbi:MAG: hypothetical protein ICV60_05610 [Pyrinomonadaceae bacterium]|nr:hypothetical protein [Pyrinomonadaceae bacterium]
MPKITVGHLTRQEIIDSMRGLKGAPAKAEAQALATRFGISLSRVYEISREVRPRRDERADKGKRRADLLEHPGTRLAAELVITRHLSPFWALRTAQDNGHHIPVSLGTFRRNLREKGISRASNRANVRPYRPFEAEYPGHIFQFDISGVKERWIDHKTRRILHVSTLDVSKNHPNSNPNRIPLWKFGLVDDFSRLKYVRFVACLKPTSIHVIDFLLEAFRTLGIPRVLYSDRDRIILSKRMARAESILNRYFEYFNLGGFKLDQHQAGNPQATGKVEVGHRIVEEYEKLIGVSYRQRTLEELNAFCVQLCDHYNWRENRATGEKPMIRWQAGHKALRIPPDKLLDSAFKADEFECKLTAKVTISFQGAEYQLPRKSPFVDWINKTIKVIWPPDESYYWIVGLDGNEYEIERKLARADVAGEFKATPETTRQKTLKNLRASTQERKQAHMEEGTDLITPGFETPLVQEEEAANRPPLFPKKREKTNPDLLAALGPGIVPPSMSGHLIDYWTAVALLVEEEVFSTPAADHEKEWLKAVFAGRDEILDTELRERLAERPATATILDLQRRA